MSLIPVNSTPTLAADELDTLRRTIGHDLDPNEFELFAAICRRTGLDPFARQIYAVKRWDGRQRKEVMQIQTGIDGLRLIAERSSNYAGQTPAEWCGEDGKWVDVWLSSKPPAAARVGVLRHDFEQPMYGVAKFSSYCAKTKDGKPQALWATMPEVMIAKCAEALAIRKAFPNDVSGVYTREEMAQQENTPAPVSRPSKPERVTAEVMPQVSGGGDAGTVPPAVVASPGVTAPDRQAPATTVEPALFQQGEVGTAPPDGTAAVGGEIVTGGGQVPPTATPSGDTPATLKETDNKRYQALNRFCRAVAGGWDEDVRAPRWEALAYQVSGARTTHLGELTPEEAQQFRARIEDGAKGRAHWVESDNPAHLGWTLEAGA
jgi:phage recombination protein Bet